MNRRESLERSNDSILVEAIIRGEQGAWEEFVHRFSDFVYTLCSSVFAEGELEREYLGIFRHLQADDFAVLRAFNGRAALSTFLTLRLRELLGRRVLDLFKSDTRRAWEVFQRYFKELLEPLKRRSEDLYQDICVELVDNNYRRIVSFDGRGSFTGYMRRVIDNLCLDHRRESEGRRRVPEPVLRLPALEQEIYRQLYWKGCREGDLPDILRDATGNLYAPARIEQGLIALRNTPLRQSDQPIQESSLVSADGDDEGREIELPDSTYAPEAVLLDGGQWRVTERRDSALEKAVTGLPTELALYVRLRFYSNPEKSPREIARLMGRPEREIYRIRQQAIAVLKMALKKGAV
jgi:RNA polymerase primary sigma factor